MSAASIKSLYLSLKNEITNTCTRLEYGTLYKWMKFDRNLHWNWWGKGCKNWDTDSIVCLLLIHKFKKDLYQLQIIIILVHVFEIFLWVNREIKLNTSHLYCVKLMMKIMILNEYGHWTSLMKIFRGFLLYQIFQFCHFYKMWALSSQIMIPECTQVKTKQDSSFSRQWIIKKHLLLFWKWTYPTIIRKSSFFLSMSDLKQNISV